MFNNKSSVEEVKILKAASKKLLQLESEKVLEDLRREKDREIGYVERANENLRAELSSLKQSLESKNRIKTKEDTLELKIENNRLLEKVKILEKAFDNLGFDVKDMKEILNKLVDGLIAKNEIKLIK